MDSQTSLTPPTRFAYVNPGVSRGAYPTLRNFRFLSRLQLKTIVSLTPEPPTADLVLFADMAGIQLVHLQVTRLCPLSEGLQETIINAVNVCVEAKTHPVYVHCLDGRRISSLVVLLLRRLQGWAPLYCLSEFWRYQVERGTKELEAFAGKCGNVLLPESMPK
ncbi:protein-tyrosine phosphatase [Ochromonadaceae sp. CCMP2298]|nr:protein-tyrosine phosphatase [Ochromonadaceae sp. CCMP2298]